MAIRTMNAATYDKIADPNKASQPTESINTDDLEFLYEKGMKELENIYLLINSMASYMETTFVPDMLLSPEVLQFLTFVKSSTKDIVPAILRGEFENFEVEEEELENARIEMYNRLYDKYLK